jgi:anti-sigma regulatory factor (Ser/Thr protein kinase)
MSHANARHIAEVRLCARLPVGMNTRRPPAGRASDETRQGFPRDTSQLAEIRRFVRTWFAQRDVPANVIDDFELAVSELATNATQHGAGATIEIELGVDGDGFSAVVSADTEHAGRIGTVDSWQIAAADAMSGRGLGIVAAVMDVVEVDGDAGRAVFRCRRRR